MGEVMKSRVMKASDINDIAEAMSRRAMEPMLAEITALRSKLSKQIHAAVFTPAVLDDVIVYNNEVIKANALIDQAEKRHHDAMLHLSEDCDQDIENPRYLMTQHGDEGFTWIPRMEYPGRRLERLNSVKDDPAGTWYAVSVTDYASNIEGIYHSGDQDVEVRRFEVEAPCEYPNIQDYFRWNESIVVADKEIYVEVGKYDVMNQSVRNSAHDLEVELRQNMMSARTTAAIIKAWPEMEQVLLDYYGEKEFVETPLSAVIDKYVRLALPAA